MATLLFDATELKSFWCSTMQSYQKLSTKVLSSLVLFATTTYLFECGFSSLLRLKIQVSESFEPFERFVVGSEYLCAKVSADNFREAAKMSLGWFLMSSKV